MLTLQAKEKEIENLTPDEEFVRGTVGAKCQINFDEFWQSYNKYIVFKRVGYEPINFMVDTLENEIEIPYTILAESGEFKIGVFGITETETLPTLYSKDIKIRYGTDTHGTTPPTYIPSEIDQLRLSKQDKLVSGENIKTINNQSILGSGNITIEGGSDVEVDQNYLPTSENAQSGKAVAEAVSDKQDSLVSGTNIKTINNQSILGSGNITIEGGSGSSITVDQTFNPESENAQSGKAVAEAVVSEQKRANNTFSNALKGSKSGSAILIDDVSPVTREMSAKISSDTVEDLTAVKVSRCGKNLITFPYTYDGHTYGVGDTYTHNGITFTVNEDRSITANGTATADANFDIFSAYGTWLVDDNKSVSVTLSGCPSGGSSTTYFLAQKNYGYRDVGSGITFQTRSGTNSYAIMIKSGTTVENLIFKPQLELGTTATEYEPYITPTEFTPTADGTVEGVTSLYPNTTLTTDTAGVLIDCEYNRDINKAFAALEAAIATNNS